MCIYIIRVYTHKKLKLNNLNVTILAIQLMYFKSIDFIKYKNSEAFKIELNYFKNSFSKKI